MGTRGPVKTSATKNRLRGNPGRRNRKTAKAKAANKKATGPSMPKWLGKDGSAEWRRVVGRLVQMGILDELDRTALALYCRAFEEYCRARREVEAEGFTATTDKGNLIQHPAVGVMHRAWGNVLKAAGQLGLTPLARRRLEMDEGPDESDPLVAHLFRMGETRN